MMLPAGAARVLEGRLEGQRRDVLAKAADRFSAAYRSGYASGGVIASDIDALAYALVRMPATFAAVRVALAEARRLAPDYRPRRVLDIGAGTGAAALAAKAIWPDIQEVLAVEPNAPLARVATAVLAAENVAVAHTADDVRTVSITQGVDVALAAYVLVELDAVAAAVAVGKATSAATELVAFVEPGTPRGFERIRLARDQIMAAGWHVLAPCPHALACPLLASDWCHQYVRLARSRAHRSIKGADAPYEDEPLSYVVASRLPHTRSTARILRVPKVEKGAVRLTLCCNSGLTTEMDVPRREKAAYRVAKDLDAGDAWEV
jgi:ribosomal protein RSM22 (predicted rRNA methylase)